MNEEVMQDQELTQDQEVVQEPTETVQEQPQEEESIQAKNFRELREQAKEYKRMALEQQRLTYAQQQELERIKKALEESQTKKEPDYTDDEFVERKHLNETRKQLDETKRQFEERLARQEQQLDEQYILAKCPDFYSVVTDDAVDLLQKNHPELASAVQAAGSMRARALSAYKLIKKFVHEDREQEYEKKKIAENLKKPKPVQQSALTHAHSFEKRMTEKERADFYNEMVNFSKRL